MKWYQAIFLASAVIVSATSCKKKNARFPPVPAINFLRMTPDSIKSMSSEDTVRISFHFTDGDADLGNDPNSGKKDIFVIDTRFPDDTFGYYFPPIPDQFKDPEKGLEGDCDFYIPAALLPGLRDTTIHKLRDTTAFNIFIKDVAGNASNLITTSRLLIHK